MGASKLIKMRLLDREMTQTQFAEEVGMAYQTFKNMLARDTMKYSTVEKFADLLGCEVVLRDKKTGKLYR